MSLVSALKGKGKSGFGYGSTAEDVTEGVDLSGKRFLVTGCNSGLGAEVLRVLVLRGAHVVGTARNKEKAARARAPFGQKATPLACELSEPASVLDCVARAKESAPFDGIIANAGIMALPKLEVKHGLELQFLTNHIGHFILVTGLLDSLNPQGRVVMLSSTAHNMAPSEGVQLDNLDGQKGYEPWKAYGQSKLSNLLFAKELARRLPGSQQTANAVHPGVIQTGLQRSMNPVLAATFKFMSPLVLKSVPEGAATETFVATHPSLGKTNGEYFADCNLSKCSKLGLDSGLAERLWTKSESLVAGFH